jgi:hypothetical protein
MGISAMTNAGIVARANQFTLAKHIMRFLLRIYRRRGAVAILPYLDLYIEHMENYLIDRF